MSTLRGRVRLWLLFLYGNHLFDGGTKAVCLEICTDYARKYLNEEVDVICVRLD